MNLGCGACGCPCGGPTGRNLNGGGIGPGNGGGRKGMGGGRAAGCMPNGSGAYIGSNWRLGDQPYKKNEKSLVKCVRVRKQVVTHKVFRSWHWYRDCDNSCCGRSTAMAVAWWRWGYWSIMAAATAATSASLFIASGAPATMATALVGSASWPGARSCALTLLLLSWSVQRARRWRRCTCRSVTQIPHPITFASCIREIWHLLFFLRMRVWSTPENCMKYIRRLLIKSVGLVSSQFFSSISFFLHCHSFVLCVALFCFVLRECSDSISICIHFSHIRH